MPQNGVRAPAPVAPAPTPASALTTASAVCHSPLKSIYDKINTRTVLKFAGRTPPLENPSKPAADPICPVFALLRCLFVSSWRCHQHQDSGFSIQYTGYRTPGSGPTTQNEESVAASAAVTFNVEIFFLLILSHWQTMKRVYLGALPGSLSKIGLRMCCAGLGPCPGTGAGSSNLMGWPKARFRHFNVHDNLKSTQSIVYGQTLWGVKLIKCEYRALPSI